eukprot:Gb_26653 [translate_table: standard]
MFKLKNHKHLPFRSTANIPCTVRGQSKWKLQENNFNSECKVRRLDSGFPLDCNTYASLLQSCTTIKSLNQVHAQIVLSGLDQNVFLETKLVNVYAGCGSPGKARRVFDKISEPNVFSWNAIIRCYAWNGPWEETLSLYHQMQRTGIQPDEFTFPFVLKACARLSALQQGKEIHDQIIRCRLEASLYVGNALVDMYAKCGNIELARQLFDEMAIRDVVSWSAMITGYAQNGYADEALTLFHQMQLAEVKPNRATIVSVLPACAELTALQQGKDIHDYIIKNRLESDVSVRTALVTMYARCGSIDAACQLFDEMSKRDVVSWSAMIAGYAQTGHANEALSLFHQMQLAGVRPNSVTMVSVLPACAHLRDLHQGKCMHAYITKNGFESNVSVRNTLIDMYAKCGCIDIAWQLFGKMSKVDVISWNAMIAGYAHNGYANEALSIFHQMRLADVIPNRVTVVSVLPACADLAALQEGKGIHVYTIKKGFESDISVGTALVAMYAKCGLLELARKLFDRMPKRDVLSWNTMIGGYGMHGQVEDVIALFLQMQKRGIGPDHITFICVLSACSHAGFVDEGWQYFESMSRDYFITPRLEHYACMVDLLGRAGYLYEAQNFIEKMPIEPDAYVWGAFLGACRIHCNFELVEHASERLLELEPKNAGNYVLIANIYAAAGRWDVVEKMRSMLKYKGLKKNPGCSWIEIKNRVHTFLVGDSSHPQSGEIYAMIETLDEQMKEAGYSPDKSFVWYDVVEEDYIHCNPSKKLAIA